MGTLVTLAAVLLPARRASRVSPLVAITGQTTGAKQAGKAQRWAAIAGAVIALAGIAALVLGTVGHSLYVTAGGAALIALGTLAALPLLVGGAVGLIGRLGDAERRPILHLAARNLERNPGRSAASAATLFVCALVGSTLFVGLFSFTSSFQNIVNQASPTDITIFGVTPQTDTATLKLRRHLMVVSFLLFLHVMRSHVRGRGCRMRWELRRRMNQLNISREEIIGLHFPQRIEGVFLGDLPLDRCVGARGTHSRHLPLGCRDEPVVSVGFR